MRLLASRNSKGLRFKVPSWILNIFRQYFFVPYYARYGSTTGGTPHHHSANNYVAWCQQLGGVYESHTVGTKTGYQLFWCCNYDENKWKWCDWLDGKWYNSPLGYHRTSGQFVTSITCKKH